MGAPNSTSTTRARGAGILLHPTCLPGPYGIGDLGPAAHAWIEALARAKQTWWQVLPLGPTGYADSPYACLSAFAGNPALVSPELLLQDGLVHSHDLEGVRLPAERVDYGAVLELKARVLGVAWERFRAGHAPGLRQEFEAFRAAHARWLDDYALFRAIKDAHGGASWVDWEEDLVRREPAALERARRRLADAIDAKRFYQFLFFRQWHALREHARAMGIRILGDAPIFVATDSADVWTHPRYFKLDARLRPRVVAGVPPDYFSATGQLWGNPLYDWEALARDRFSWWVDRLRATVELVDLVRIDHFRGFAASWEVAAGRPTAEIGEWVPSPGAALFETLRSALGNLPILVEDLGVITPEVHALRDRFRLPGIRVLQFAFGGDQHDRFLPHSYVRNTVVYTGTHDNDTTRGWYATLPESERAFLHRYLGGHEPDVPWDLIRLAWSSVANTALVPLQDVLELGSEARMNRPGTDTGNWTWRFTPDQLGAQVLERLGGLTETYGRAPDAAAPKDGAPEDGTLEDGTRRGSSQDTTLQGGSSQDATLQGGPSQDGAQQQGPQHAAARRARPRDAARLDA